MARESEGEELGGGAGVCGVGERERGRSPSSAGRGERRGGGQLRGACWRRHRAAACLPGQAKKLAGAVAGLGRQVGLLGGAR